MHVLFIIIIIMHNTSTCIEIVEIEMIRTKLVCILTNWNDWSRLSLLAKVKFIVRCQFACNQNCRIGPIFDLPPTPPPRGA